MRGKAGCTKSFNIFEFRQTFIAQRRERGNEEKSWKENLTLKTFSLTKKLFF
jgi:hypothetical protein